MTAPDMFHKVAVRVETLLNSLGTQANKDLLIAAWRAVANAPTASVDAAFLDVETQTGGDPTLVTLAMLRTALQAQGII